MNIREAISDDLGEILDLFRNTIREVNKEDYSSEQLKAWAAGADDRKRWLYRIRQHYFLVAEKKGAIVGFASITREGYLDTMFVHKDHQGEGVAKALLEEIMEFAMHRNLTSITTDASVTARPFFEKHGFTVIAKQSVNRKGITLTNFKMYKRNFSGKG